MRFTEPASESDLQKMTGLRNIMGSSTRGWTTALGSTMDFNFWGGVAYTTSGHIVHAAYSFIHLGTCSIETYDGDQLVALVSRTWSSLLTGYGRQKTGSYLRLTSRGAWGGVGAYREGKDVVCDAGFRDTTIDVDSVRGLWDSAMVSLDA
ncbi:hypothetical protein FRC12_015174 [Ceratobasidium sp. 428]|nr:hypothetical protein FRC12_015174 [Ceratobasidium sp. 428]